MKLQNTLHFLVLLGTALLCTSCDPPELREKSANEIVTEAEPASEPKPAPMPPPVVEKIEEPAPERVFVEPTEPYLLVERKDSKIIVTGAVRSASHQQRIGEQLTAAFAKDEIVNNLEVDYDRHAVPWTGRVTEQFLIPYLREVENPLVEYKEGNITLKGTVEREGMIRNLTEMGIESFSSVFSKGVDNQLKAKGR